MFSILFTVFSFRDCLNKRDGGKGLKSCIFLLKIMVSGVLLVGLSVRQRGVGVRIFVFINRVRKFCFFLESLVLKDFIEQREDLISNFLVIGFNYFRRNQLCTYIVCILKDIRDFIVKRKFYSEIFFLFWILVVQFVFFDVILLVFVYFFGYSLYIYRYRYMVKKYNSILCIFFVILFIFLNDIFWRFFRSLISRI